MASVRGCHRWVGKKCSLAEEEKEESLFLLKSLALFMGIINKSLNSIFIGAIKLYQITLSPFLGNNCRFRPTCSQYGIGAFRSLPFLKAVFLTTKRILRCHPFSGGGIDPVPK
jgi:hypothetical protein